jgi:SET domain-containing protein
MKVDLSTPVTAKKTGRKIQIRQSGVHGKGVFATQDMAAGDRVIEYLGEIISAKEAEDRHPHNPQDPNHTFYFQIEEDRVIDGLHGGNASRWINHSCAPNCEPEVTDGRVFINALRPILVGEELNYDYGLIIDEPMTKKLKAQYPCRCGSPLCRGTLLAVKSKPSRKEKKAELADLKKQLKKIKSQIDRLTKSLAK